MSQMGLGVMIRHLGTRRGLSEEEVALIHGKRISRVVLNNGSSRHNSIEIKFESGPTLVLSDEGQSCCESRYITSDDDLGYYSGADLYDVELGEHRESNSSEYGDCHEIQFLNVRTSKGVITFETHNEHNGYYGGFSIEARLQQ